MDLQNISKTEWEEKYGSLKTIADKKDAIVRFLASVEEEAELRKGKDTEFASSYRPIWWLRETISMVMNWRYKERYIRSWAGEDHTVIDFDIDDTRVTKTLERMVETGYIRISKSGKAYMALRTK